MGRSKFPGKPSKHTHRKRINVLPPTGELTNITENVSVTVTTAKENKQDEEELSENQSESELSEKEPKVLRKRLPRKLNTSTLRKNGRKRGFISSLRTKNSLKANRTTRNSTFRRESTNLAGKFVLPTRSVHSSRVIKPNKRFIDINDSLTVKKKVVLKRTPKPDEPAVLDNTKCNEVSSNLVNDTENSEKPSFSNGQRVILRQARLKLPIQTGTQGPFSSKLHNGPGTIICGVCGAVRYYRFVKQARKFNIYSCESCRKFIAKQIKRQTTNTVLPCHKGLGTCYVPPVVRTQHWKLTKFSSHSRCPACWLKMCLRAYHLPPNLKENLTQLLPRNMRGIDLAVNNTLPPLLWQKNIANPSFSNTNTPESSTLVKQRPVRFKTSQKINPSVSTTTASEIKRQKIDFKGPRVKHVCRSASIVLGQPLATFSNEDRKCDTLDQSLTSSKPNDVKAIVNLSKSDTDSESRASRSSSSIDESSNLEQQLRRDSKLRCLPNVITTEANLSSTEEKPVQEGIYLDYSSDLNYENNIKYGFAIIGSQKFPIGSICFLCGSGGREIMLICSVCCEPYHDFCVDKTHAIPTKNVDLKDIEWICMKCSKCNDCNGIDRTKIGCPRCLKVYHPECFNPEWETHCESKPSFCKYCTKCCECGTASWQSFPGNQPLCLDCVNKKRSDMICPICQNSYNDNNYSSCKVLECLKCKSWIHSDCAKLTTEQYDLIRILPKSSQFVCSSCSNNFTPTWKSAVLTEMRSCFNHILWKLSRNKTTRNVLKWRNLTNKVTTFRSLTRKLNSGADSDLVNNNCSKDLTDIHKIYSFEENERLEKQVKESKSLLDIKCTLHEYFSIKQFHNDMQEALKLTHSDHVLNIFKKLFRDIFPWFTILHEHDNSEVEIISQVDVIGSSSISIHLPPVPDDTRTCILCRKVGDGLLHEESRLLYCGSNKWIHANCAYWSVEVYEEIDNYLQNVHSTIDKSQLSICVMCKKNGATVQCNICPKEIYHFICAKNANCIFTKLKKACFCPKHPPVSISGHKYILKRDIDFHLNRSIYIEPEDNNRPIAKLNEVNYLVGSLCVTDLGQIEPILSDNQDAIIPVGFVCSRLFWSTVEPWKLIPYTITTSVQNPNCSILTVDKNFTVDHTSSKIEHDKVLRELTLWQREYERKVDDIDMEYEEEEKNGADLLSPELTDTILEDLPHDILDGISVQDIFPNFSYEDMLSLDNSNTEIESFKKSDDEEITRCKSDVVSKMDSKSRLQTQRSCSLTVSCKLDSPAVKKRKITTGRENNMYYHLLQVDGNCDESSSSECGSPTGLVTTDIWGNYVTDEPVTCEKCHSTYRTQASYKRHLDSCEFLCSSESDSENVPESDIFSTEVNFVHTQPNLLENNQTTIINELNNQPLMISSYQSYQSEVHTSVQNYLPTTKPNDVILPQTSEEIINFPHVNEKSVLQTIPTISLNENITASHEQASAYTINQSSLPITEPSATISIPNNQYCMSQSIPLCVNLPQQVNNPTSLPVNSSLESEIQLTPASLINNGNNLHTISINPINHINQQQSQNTITVNQINQHPIEFSQTQPVAIQQIPYNNVNQILNVGPQNQFTVNGKLLNPVMHPINVPSTQWVHKVNKQPIAQKIVKSRARSRIIAAKRTGFDEEQQQILLPTSNQGQVIVQHLPSTNFVPYVDAFHPQAGQNVQYVATISPQVNSVPQPLVQIQPDNNIISIVPGLQPTMIIQQPRVIENQLVLDSNGTIGWSPVPQPQPVYYGFETIVQNTVMQSQQFLPTTVPGVLTANSSYSTTTQVFQTSKLEPVLDVASNSFVLVNPGQLVNSQVEVPQPYSTAIIAAQTPNLIYSQSSPATHKSLTVPSTASNSINLPTAPFVSDQGIPMNIVTPIPKSVSQSRPMSRVLPMPTNIAKPLKPAEDSKILIDEKPIQIKIEDTSFNYSKESIKLIDGSTKQQKKFEILDCQIIRPPNVPVKRIQNRIKIEAKPLISKMVETSKCTSTHSPDIQKIIKQDFVDHPLVANAKTEQKIRCNEQDNIIMLKNDINTIHEEKVTNKILIEKKEIKRDIIVEEIIKPAVENIKQVNRDTPQTKQVQQEEQCNIDPKIDSSLKIVFQKQTLDGTYKISSHPAKQIDEPCKTSSSKSVLQSLDGLYKTSSKPAVVAPLRPSKHQLPGPKEGEKKIASEEALAPKVIKKDDEAGCPLILYSVQTHDGFKYSSNSVSDCWSKVLEAVQNARAAHNMPPLPSTSTKSMKSIQIVGLKSGHMKYLLEQLPGASKCRKYKPMFNFTPHPYDIVETTDHLFGSIRCQPYQTRNMDNYDMFSWLSSKHRQPFNMSMDSQVIQSRRVNNLPLAMKFRNLRVTSKWSVGVYRSSIHGRGLFCLRDIEAGEMVIEYAGEVIRSILTDKREKLYNSKGIGCYMFRVDDNFVVDATMKGNAARFINHSCDPNCYSKVVEILGHKHIVIFALRRIISGEELTYDYKFPFEEDKIPCTCGARRCRKFLN